VKTIRVGRRHQFVEDPAMQDPRTRAQWCLCGLPVGNAVHDVAQRSDEEAAYEARRMGESE
jgi:hypothetical protein